MQFFSQGIHRHFNIFDHRITICLVIECLFLGTLDRMLKQVVHTSNASCLTLFNELLTAAANEHRLHVAFRLREVEQFPSILGTTHLNKSFPLVVTDIGKRSRGNIQVRCTAALGYLNYLICHGPQ